MHRGEALRDAVAAEFEDVAGHDDSPDGWERAVHALIPEGSVVVDRARFARVLACAKAAHAWAHVPYAHGADGGEDSWARAESVLVRSTMALEPGDLEAPRPTHDTGAHQQAASEYFPLP